MAVTVTDKRHDNFIKLTFTVTTETDGTATGVTTYKITGEVFRFVVVPGVGGNQPTNLFDIELQDADGYDTLLGLGTNLSNADTTTAVASMGVVVHDVLTLAVTNAGSVKTMTVVAYIKR